MSAHNFSSSENAEPNLVPLLDLVLQLVMFFMMVANFVMEENDQTIKLPVSQMAAPIADSGTDIVHLGVDDQGTVLVVGRKPMTREDELITFLRETADANRKRMPEKSDIKTLVIIRASRDCSYSKIYTVMRRCQEAGLRHLQLRADKG